MQPGNRSPSAITEQHDPYVSIDRAYQMLRQGRPLDPDAMQEVCAHLRVLGLGEPASELERLGDSAAPVADSGAPGEHAPASYSPRDDRPDAPPGSGRVPGAITRAVIEQNLRLTADRAEVDAQWLSLMHRLAEHIHVHRCSSGFLHASVVGRDGIRAWVPAFRRSNLDPALSRQLDALAALRAFVIGITEPIIAKIHAVTSSPPDQPARVLYLCDPEPLRWLAWFATGDRSTILCDPRCMLLTGPDSAEHYRTLLLENPDLPVHAALIDTLQQPELKAAIQRATTSAAHDRAQRCRALASEIASRETTRTDADCAARLVPGALIMGVVSRFTTMVCHSMRDMAAACEGAGYRFHIIEESSAHEPHSNETIMRTIRDEDPALIVLINHLRHEYADMFGSTPMVTWIQDPVDNILSSSAAAKCGRRDFFVGFYRSQCIERHGYDGERFLGLPHYPVSARIFHDHDPDDNENADAVPCDMIYVGHLHQTPEELLEQRRSAESGLGVRLIDGIDHAITQTIERRRPLTHAGAEVLVESVAEELGGRLEPESIGQLAHGFAFRLYDMRYRIESLSWAAQWAATHGRTLRIHGRGWDRLDVLRPYAHPPIAHGPALRRAYRAAALALQTIPSGFSHQRTFEALLSGSLPLVRYTPLDFAGMSVTEFRDTYGAGESCPNGVYPAGFTGLDRIVFQTASEFCDLAERMYAPHGPREEIRRALADVVRSRLTYDRYMPEILRFVRAGLER